MMRFVAIAVVLALALGAGCGDDGGGNESGPLTAPTGLKVSTVDGKAHLTWTDALNEDSYMVERMDHSQSNPQWAVVKGAEELVPNTVQYHDASAEAGKTYMYRIMAMKGSEQALSNEVTWP